MAEPHGYTLVKDVSGKTIGLNTKNWGDYGGETPAPPKPPTKKPQRKRGGKK